MSKNGNPDQQTDVSPAVEAIKRTGGKAEGEKAMSSEMAGQRRAARMVQNKGMKTPGQKIASNPGIKMVTGTEPQDQPHEQGWGK